jgi:hypothetical protein
MHEADHELPAQEVDLLLRQLVRFHSREEGSTDDDVYPFAAVPDDLKGLD